MQEKSFEGRYTFEEYDVARKAAQGESLHDFKKQLTLGALGLAGETGEVIDLIKKHLYHGIPLPVEKIALELGDVLWYIRYIADTIGADLEIVARMNDKKLSERYPNGFSIEDAIKKEEA